MFFEFSVNFDLHLIAEYSFRETASKIEIRTLDASGYLESGSRTFFIGDGSSVPYIKSYGFGYSVEGKVSGYFIFSFAYFFNNCPTWESSSAISARAILSSLLVMFWR